MMRRQKREDLIIPLYDEGLSLRQVALATGYSIEGVRQYLKRHEVPVRLPYGAGEEIAPDEITAIVQEVKKGSSIDDVASMFGLLPSRVSVLVRRELEREERTA